MVVGSTLWSCESDESHNRLQPSGESRRARCTAALSSNRPVIEVERPVCQILVTCFQKRPFPTKPGSGSRRGSKENCFREGSAGFLRVLVKRQICHQVCSWRAHSVLQSDQERASCHSVPSGRRVPRLRQVMSKCLRSRAGACVPGSCHPSSSPGTRESPGCRAACCCPCRVR